MILLSKKPVTLAEVKALANNLEENKDLQDYMKAFTKLSKDKAEKLAEEIRGLNNVKIREENVVKIVDFLPQSQEDVGKIFNNVNLTEEETNAILAIVKNY